MQYLGNEHNYCQFDFISQLCAYYVSYLTNVYKYQLLYLRNISIGIEGIRYTNTTCYSGSNL